MLVRSRFSTVQAVLAAGICWVMLGCTAFSADAPQGPAASGGQAQPANWTITLSYGGGTPNDAGPLGHCTATFRGDGRVKIESRGQQPGFRDVVVYENDALSPELVEAISRAADAALQEKPFTRHGDNADGDFLRLDRPGATRPRVYHNELSDFCDAPPAMLKFVALMNGLLPASERVPLVPTRRPKAEDKRATNKVAKPPEWTIIVRLERPAPNHEWLATHKAQFSADGVAKLMAEDTILYQNDALVAEDLDILRTAVEASCKESPVDGGAEHGLAIRLEILNRDGRVVKQHRDYHLHRYGGASPGAVRVVHWLSDHSPKASRVDLSVRAAAK